MRDAHPMIKRTFLIALLMTSAAGFSAPAWSMTPAEMVAFEIALKQAIKISDYATIFMLIKPRAEDGDAESQYVLGRLYMQGKGVEQSYAKASYWFQQSASQHYPPAQNYLAALCSRKPTFCR